MIASMLSNLILCDQVFSVLVSLATCTFDLIKKSDLSVIVCEPVPSLVAIPKSSLHLPFPGCLEYSTGVRHSTLFAFNNAQYMGKLSIYLKIPKYS